MSSVDAQLIEKIEDTLTKFEHVANSCVNRKGYSHFEDEASHEALGVEACALMDHIYGAEHPNAERVRMLMLGTTLSHLNSAKGVLRGTAEAIRKGLLIELRTSVLLDVQSDFIECARSALANGAKDVAAALLCVVLEDSVKRLAVKSGHADLVNMEFSVVVSELFKLGAITKSTKGVLLSFKDLRNSALHAQWQHVAPESVTGLLFFLPTFIEQHGV